jgi:hypothetical protein
MILEFRDQPAAVADGDGMRAKGTLSSPFPFLAGFGTDGF